jgi:Uma2 family endonuclease
MSTAYEGKADTHYTYTNYREWDTQDRYEIVDGTAYMMGAPTVTHQTISRELFGQFWTFLRGKSCQVFSVPLDVRLFPREDNSDDTIVQPDILVVCDRSKLADGRSCRGTPDLVIEILSPSNTSPAMFLKYSKYLKAGVREYWVISPETWEVQTHLFEKAEGQRPGRFISTIYTDAAMVDVSIFPGLKIDFNTIWSEL